MRVIIVLNAGSSSLKFAFFSIDGGELKLLHKGSFDTNANNYHKTLQDVLILAKEKGFEIVAAGHRIVHGGDFVEAMVLDDEVINKLETLIPFSPLHQPYNLKGVAMLKEDDPKLFQTASFDSAFHATCNSIAQHYALPKELTAKGIRRYGFHGLSYEYISLQLSKYLKKADGKIIVAHLGSGSTMCAINKFKSVATSIGMTSMGGLPMGTRCGDVDPYLAVYLVDQGWSTKRIETLFYKESGLLGVSKISSDMKKLLESDSVDAKLAVDIFIHRICYFAGALAAELEGIDGFIFTGGIGTNSYKLREKVCNKLKWLDMELDTDRNKGSEVNKRISSDRSKVEIWSMATDEEVIIAMQTFNLWRKHEKRDG
jgi:acetate kinase